MAFVSRALTGQNLVSLFSMTQGLAGSVGGGLWENSLSECHPRRGTTLGSPAWHVAFHVTSPQEVDDAYGGMP